MKRPVLLAVMLAALLLLGSCGEGAAFPPPSVRQISEAEYREAFAENERDPIRDDHYSQVLFPENASAFYRISWKDQGHSAALPIELAVYLALDQEGLLLKESDFCLAPMPASPRYLNVIFFPDNSTPEKEKLHLTVDVSTVAVYDSDGTPLESIPFSYHAYGWFDLGTCETLEYHAERK